MSEFFGTDGVRGLVGGAKMNPITITQLGWGIAQYLNEKYDRPSVVIGKDTRISGYIFESALEAGLAYGGVSVQLLGVMPTPGVAYLTQTLRASMGLVISASHNPHYDNGIKLFNGRGIKLTDKDQAKIVDFMNQPMTVSQTPYFGKAYRVAGAHQRYIEKCKSAMPNTLMLSNLKIVLDCANGATYHIAPSVFKELGAQVTVIHHQPNGININLKCGATSLKSLQASVISENADVGFAFDGDGDRLMVIDGEGMIWDGDDILYALSQNIHYPSGVVGTLMTNVGLENYFSKANIPFIRAAVGDRHIQHALSKEGWHLGGETSGHIIDGRYATTGDGIIAALLLCQQVIKQKKKFSELRFTNKVQQHHHNIDLSKGMRISTQVLNNIQDQLQASIGNEGRIILRPSGTEPVIRCTIEHYSAQLAKQTLITAKEQIHQVLMESLRQ